MAWLAICDATTFSRNTKAAARQISVVVPTTGLIPITNPAAMLQASARGRCPHAQQRQDRQHGAAINPVVVRAAAGIGSQYRIDCAMQLAASWFRRDSLVSFPAVSWQIPEAVDDLRIRHGPVGRLAAGNAHRSERSGCIDSWRAPCASLGIAVRIEGRFPERGAFISNHMGYLDIVAFAALHPVALRRQVRDWRAFRCWAG